MAHNLVEKAMVTLNPALSFSEHQQYLGGYIDCLGEQHLISETDRETLYCEYCACGDEHDIRCGRIISCRNRIVLCWNRTKFAPFFVFIIAMLHPNAVLHSSN